MYPCKIMQHCKMFKTTIVKIIIEMLPYEFSDLIFIKISHFNVNVMIKVSFRILYITEYNISLVIYPFQL